jgi:hypothetical protein
MPEPTGTGRRSRSAAPPEASRGISAWEGPQPASRAAKRGIEARSRGPPGRCGRWHALPPLPPDRRWPAALIGQPVRTKACLGCGLRSSFMTTRRVPRRPARPQLDYLVLPPRRPLSHRPGLTVVGPVVRIPGSMDRVGCTCGNTGGRSRRYPFVWGHRSSQRRTGSQVVGRCGCIRAKDTLPWR